MFGFGKKKQLSLPDLPPPPSPSGMELQRPSGDLPKIRAKDDSLDLPSPPSFDDHQDVPTKMPELPSAPSFEPFEGVDLPEAPSPEMPRAPAPENHEEPQHEVSYSAEPIAPAPEMPSLQPVEEQFHESPVSDSTIAPQRMRRSPGPMYISVDEYKSILDNSNRVRVKLTEAESYLHRLEEIKAEEEKSFDRWRGQLEDVERKLARVDSVIAKARR
jgi:hypothetical protein